MRTLIGFLTGIAFGTAVCLTAFDVLLICAVADRDARKKSEKENNVNYAEHTE